VLADPALPPGASRIRRCAAVAWLYCACAKARLPVICVETRKVAVNLAGQFDDPFVVSRQLQPSVGHAMQRAAECCNVIIFRELFALFGISPKFVLVGHTIRSLLLTSSPPQRRSIRRRVRLETTLRVAETRQDCAWDLSTFEHFPPRHPVKSRLTRR
jgi:hypothetical protein